MSADPPREWVLHHRGWVKGGEELQLFPDAHAWDEWVMGTNSRGESCSLYLNANLRESIWREPPPVVLPITPAAVPVRAGKVVQLRGGDGSRELRDVWHLPPPDVGQPARLRYLDELPDTCRWRHVHRAPCTASLMISSSRPLRRLGEQRNRAGRTQETGLPTSV